MNINILNLCVSVSDKKVLSDLNLSIKKGEVHVIMGPNGVGKSTLSKVIMGDPTYKVVSGEITCDDVSILDLKVFERAKKGIFLTFQDPCEIEGVTNSEFLKEALNSNSSDKVGLYDFIKELNKDYTDLDLSKDLMHRAINQNFSGGEKKKNEILQMKVLKPKFLILDELDSGLDVDSLKIVCSNINDYLNEYKDTSVLIITHYPRILDFIKPTYVHVLMDGAIKLSGDLSLAKNIEKEGYKKLISSTSSVSEK